MVVFGVSLNEIAIRTRAAVPTFMEKCIMRVIQNYLNYEGIFRIQATDIDVKHDLSQIDDPSCTCNLITPFLKLIPNHILIDKNAKRWKEVKSSADIQKILNSLPLINLAILSRLFGLMKVVSEHCKENYMTSMNLSIILAPVLIYDPNDPSWLLSTEIVQKLIDEYDELFINISAFSSGEFMPTSDFSESIGNVLNMFFCQSTSIPQYQIKTIQTAKLQKMCRSISVNQAEWSTLFEGLVSPQNATGSIVTHRITPL